MEFMAARIRAESLFRAGNQFEEQFGLRTVGRSGFRSACNLG